MACPGHISTSHGEETLSLSLHLLLNSQPIRTRTSTRTPSTIRSQVTSACVRPTSCPVRTYQDGGKDLLRPDARRRAVPRVEVLRRIRRIPDGEIVTLFAPESFIPQAWSRSEGSRMCDSNTRKGVHSWTRRWRARRFHRRRQRPVRRHGRRRARGWSRKRPWCPSSCEWPLMCK